MLQWLIGMVRAWSTRRKIIVGGVLVLLVVGIFGSVFSTPPPAPVATPTSMPPTSTPVPTATALVPTSTPIPTATALVPTSTPMPTVQTWRGLTVAAENRCSDYDADDYSYSQSIEPRIVESMGGRIYGPYTGRYFNSIQETDIEHIVARSEAHDSGLCLVSEQDRRVFASDLLNLTLAAPSVNRNQKRDKDAADWLPAQNKCWFADAVVSVRRKYNLSIDQREADALDSVLSECRSVEIVFTRQVEPTPTPRATATEKPRTSSTYASCGAAETAGERRIQGSKGPGRGFPKSMVPSARDGDGDGVVCEK